MSLEALRAPRAPRAQLFEEISLKLISGDTVKAGYNESGKSAPQFRNQLHTWYP